MITNQTNASFSDHKRSSQSAFPPLSFFPLPTHSPPLFSLGIFSTFLHYPPRFTHRSQSAFPPLSFFPLLRIPPPLFFSQCLLTSPSLSSPFYSQVHYHHYTSFFSIHFLPFPSVQIKPKAETMSTPRASGRLPCKYSVSFLHFRLHKRDISLNESTISGGVVERRTMTAFSGI